MPRLVSITTTKSVEELLKTGESPIPLEVIPNHMGINLCSVKSLSWTQQPDGQLVSLTIHFSPEEPAVAAPSPPDPTDGDGEPEARPCFACARDGRDVLGTNIVFYEEAVGAFAAPRPRLCDGHKESVRDMSLGRRKLFYEGCAIQD